MDTPVSAKATGEIDYAFLWNFPKQAIASPYLTYDQQHRRDRMLAALLHARKVLSLQPECVRFDVYRTAAVLEKNQGSQRANAFLISFCKRALPRLELVAKKYECAGINSNVSAAVFGSHFDTELMQYLASRMVNMVARYNRLPDMSRADIDLLAADIANFIRAELADIDDTGFSELKTLYTWYMRAGFISLQFNVTPPHWERVTKTYVGEDEIAPAIARMFNDVWWRGRLRRIAAAWREHLQITVGNVSKKKHAYASKNCVTDWREQKRRTREFLKGLDLEDEDGNRISLIEKFDGSVANPAIRRCELMTRIRGFENICNELGYVGEFYTLTAPSKYHATTKAGYRNSKWNGASPSDTQNYLTGLWARIRAKLHREEIRIFGIRVAEPHHDGTPHWHMLMFMLPEDVERVRLIIRDYAWEDSRAILSRLQAPTGKAFEAIKELGVKTSDSKGNTRPIFSILKEMQRSFEKNNLGTSQRGEYMKTIFGEEASSAAAVLMEAASSGKLDRLTAAFKASDGKIEELVKVMQDNLGGDFKEFQSAYEAVGTDLFDQQEGSLRKLTQTATQYVLKLDDWIQKNKGLATTIGIIAGGALALIGIIGGIGLVAWPVVMGINAIIAAAGVMGTVFTVAGSAIVTALGAITWPIVAVGAAIVAGALLIRKYWEPISAFFSGVIEGIMSAFAPVGEMFAPLAPIFDGLGEKLRGVWQWFKDLIAPVKATQETLDSCKNVGVIFGQALASALIAPLNVFNKLRSGVDWLLEKLGIINKESDSLDQTAARTNAATQGNSYIPATSTYGGYQAYQPVTAPAGRSYIDQSKSEYNITLPGGVAPGHQLNRQLRDTLEQIERDKRARQRASMTHDF
ncbi:phage tail tape measure protein [Salmonella enterica]|nr:phage tail tape measure protein [Salmonella enterica]